MSLLANTSSNIATIGAAAISAVMAGFAVWFQQRNRVGDRIDQQMIREASDRVQENKAILTSWKEIVISNASAMKTQADELLQLRIRAEKAEKENLDLRIEITRLKIRITVLERNGNGNGHTASA
jgi:hypothetical protein